MNSAQNLRSRILAAITSTDSQSPFISPTQLADSLCILITEIADLLNLRKTKEWMHKEELKRRFNLSDHRCITIIKEFNIPTKYTQTGKKYYSYAEFEKAYRKALI